MATLSLPFTHLLTSLRNAFRKKRIKIFLLSPLHGRSTLYYNVDQKVICYDKKLKQPVDLTVDHMALYRRLSSSCQQLLRQYGFGFNLDAFAAEARRISMANMKGYTEEEDDGTGRGESW